MSKPMFVRGSWLEKDGEDDMHEYRKILSNDVLRKHESDIRRAHVILTKDLKESISKYERFVDGTNGFFNETPSELTITASSRGSFLGTSRKSNF